MDDDLFADLLESVREARASMDRLGDEEIRIHNEWANSGGMDAEKRKRVEAEYPVFDEPDALLDFIEQAAEDGKFPVVVAYEPKCGFPQRFVILAFLVFVMLLAVGTAALMWRF
jgi:hypothetical protein